MRIPPPVSSSAPPRLRKLPLALLALLFCGFALALWFTRIGDAPLELSAPPALPASGGLVDQTPLRTARELASQVAVSGERQFALDALRYADSEVDQAFATALRLAAEHPQALTGEALEVQQRLASLKQRTAAEQANVQALTALAQAAKVTSAADAQQRVELAQAQLALDLDEADDLQQDLLRLGGERHNALEQALSEHEAIQNKATDLLQNTLNAALETPDALRTFPGKFRAFSSLRSRARSLAKARNDALSLAQSLAARHAALEARTLPAADQAAGAQNSGVIGNLRAMASGRKSLAEFDRRIHDEQELASTYGKWQDLVASQQRVVLYRILRTCAAAVLILCLMLAANEAIKLLALRITSDRRRQQTLRLLLTLGAQIIGISLLVVVLFGTPQQTPTILGIASAGLTIALKDFIVAFCGWFVLMGRNGVRTGDWVEINGVGGEVVELGLLRTVLLETGNWTESGRPTGRRVAFMNGYAIEGHFFNFSTVGQWLWDELRINLNASDDVYEKAEAIRRAVLEVTGDDVEQAEREWERATQRYGIRAFSAEPTVDLRPSGGIEVVVRYITRAQDRHQVRSQLYARVLQVMHTPEPMALAGMGRES